MSLDRRNFLQMALAWSAQAALTGAEPMKATTQVTTLGTVEEAAPDFYRSLVNFGTTVLNGGSASSLTNWLGSRLATPAPPPKTFSDQFNPYVQIVGPMKNNNAFRARTTLNGRSVVVDTLPHVVATEEHPTGSTAVNVPEMNELSNLNNPFLYKQDCGCLFRLPLNTAPRREPTENESEQFIRWAHDGGVQASPMDLRSRLDLDYVRDFCTCEGTPLKGYAFRDPYYMNGQKAKFSIAAAYT